MLEQQDKMLACLDTAGVPRLESESYLVGTLHKSHHLSCLPAFSHSVPHFLSITEGRALAKLSEGSCEGMERSVAAEEFPV